MVFKYGDSSDSEEERHDRFRNERSNTTHVKSHADRSWSRKELPSRPRLCALCDIPVTSCLCSKSDRRHSPRVTPHRERAKGADFLEDRYYSRKRRSSTEERRSVKRRWTEKETRAEEGEAEGEECCVAESGVGSKWSGLEQCSSPHHRQKKCKKKMRKRKEEEELRKKHGRNDGVSGRETELPLKDVSTDSEHRDTDSTNNRESSSQDSTEPKKDRHKSKVDSDSVRAKSDKSVDNHRHPSQSTSYKREKDRRSSESDTNTNKRREDSKQCSRSDRVSSVDRIKRKQSVDSDKAKHSSDSRNNRDVDSSKDESKQANHTSRSESGDVDKGTRKRRSGTHTHTHSHTHTDTHTSDSDSTAEAHAFLHQLTRPGAGGGGGQSGTTCYGPTLPPPLDLINATAISGKEEIDRCGDSLGTDGRKTKTCVEETERDRYGPTLPPSAATAYGPQLPTQHQHTPTYGPTLPPTCSSSRSEDLKRDGGPMIRGSDDVQDDDDTFGPVPEGSSLTPSQILLQHRANLLRIHSSHKVDKERSSVKREEWMLELPDGHGSGLPTLVTARSFKTKPTDSHIDPSWTDSPAEKIRKKELAQFGVEMEGCRKKSDRDRDVMERLVSEKRDQDMDKLLKASSHNKSSSSSKSKSLLQLHHDKLAKQNKKAKKEGKKEERRPFNRETDLSTTRLTNAQKQSIYSKAQHLHSRFSSGRAKYL